MSTVAVRVTDTNVEVAVDSQVSYGESMVLRGESLADQKMWYTPSHVLVAVVGSNSLGCILRRWTKRETPSGNTEYDICEYVDRFNAWKREEYPDASDDENGLGFILAFGGRCWVVDDYSISEVNPGGYMAHGSGADVALGALAMGATVGQAVIIACGHDIYSSPPMIDAQMRRDGESQGKIHGHAELVLMVPSRKE